MSLLSDRDRQTVQTHLGGLTHDVTLLFFTQTIGAPETVLIARQVVDEVAGLSDRISVEEVNLVLDKEKSDQFGIDRIPAIVLLRDGADTRMRFLGAPAGYEFSSLVESILLAGTDDSGLTEESKRLIAEKATEPLDIKVFVTPTCPHCPRAVTLAHRMAVESPNISATCVEASEFHDLSRKYRVTGVPKTVSSSGAEVLGALPEDQFVVGVLEGQLDPGLMP
ncbi:MAG TPA: thioredoxin family protein [Vicinamibacterales bacterium]|jgi:glutaredoxin-like protein|nr:thioredoxin family protein [Vicinamibacterales bacterium]